MLVRQHLENLIEDVGDGSSHVITSKIVKSFQGGFLSVGGSWYNEKLAVPWQLEIHVPFFLLYFMTLMQ